MGRPLPSLDVPVINPTGQMNQSWFEYFQNLNSTVKVLGAPTSFAVSPLTPGNTTVTVTLGAITDSGNNGTGVVHAFIGYNSVGTTAQVLQTLYDSFTTIASYINTIRTDITADQTAVAALNTRVTALENKIDAMITDLAARFP